MAAIASPMQVDVTQDRLAALLKEAADAHHVYEEERGEEDEDWHTWYAAYVLQELEKEQAEGA